MRPSQEAGTNFNIGDEVVVDYEGVGKLYAEIVGRSRNGIWHVVIIPDDPPEENAEVDLMFGTFLIKTRAQITRLAQMEQGGPPPPPS